MRNPIFLSGAEVAKALSPYLCAKYNIPTQTIFAAMQIDNGYLIEFPPEPPPSNPPIKEKIMPLSVETHEGSKG
jgi:hypothetical protein